jgi:hypothetical protein
MRGECQKCPRSRFLSLNPQLSTINFSLLTELNFCYFRAFLPGRDQLVEQHRAFFHRQRVRLAVGAKDGKSAVL